jgi:hypothetical protein
MRRMARTSGLDVSVALRPRRATIPLERLPRRPGRAGLATGDLLLAAICALGVAILWLA